MAPVGEMRSPAGVKLHCDNGYDPRHDELGGGGGGGGVGGGGGGGVLGGLARLAHITPRLESGVCLRRLDTNSK